MVFIEYQKGSKYPLPNADTSDNHESFEDCGVMLEDDDLVLDIDNIEKEVLERIIEEFNIKTQTVWTDRGVHLYFKKPKYFKQGIRNCALGIKIEYKTNKTNKSITIKRNGILRKIENLHTREPLPLIFKLNNKFKELYGLGNGDGRNNELRDHRIKLNNCEDYKKILKFINDYIFSEPLEEKELNNTILRDDFSHSNFSNDEYEIANYMMNDLNIKRVGQYLYFYNGIYYESDDIKLKKLIYEKVGNKKTKFIDEIYKQISYRAMRIVPKTMPIKFKNGLLKDGEFLHIDYEDFTLYYIDIEYNENAPNVEIVDYYLDQITEYDKDYKNYIFEILAHCLITDAELKRAIGKFFIFVGKGGNGKGTLLQVIRTILGVVNCSGLSIKQMTDERYYSSMMGKLANLGDDIDDNPIDHKDIKALKNVSTCDAVEIRKLFKNSETEVLTASLIFTSNSILKSFEKGDSYKRRVVWLPMFNKVKKSDTKIISKLTTKESLEYFIKEIVKAYFRLYRTGTFSECQKIEKWNKKYHEENDGASTFLNDYKKEDIIGKRPTDIYESFKVWCDENDYNASKKLLYSAIQSKFNLISAPKNINGKTARIFIENE